MRRIVFIGFMLCSLVMGFAQTVSDDWYIGKTIRNIKFEGIVVVANKQIDPIINEFTGQVFDEALWTNLLAKVYALDLFENINPEAIPGDNAYSTVIVLFKVKEKPSVETITINGNVGLRTQEILTDLSTKTKTIFNSSKMHLDEIAIRKLYLSKGYPDIQVSASYLPLDSGNIAVTFTVDEGARVIVESIKIEGASVISVSTLKSEMTLKEKNLFRSGQFSELLLTESKEAIIKLYKKRGYIDMAIVDITRSSEPDPKDSKVQKLTITFTISEGREYKFGGLSFSGNTLYTSEELASLVKIKTGAILNYDRLLQSKELISDKYYDNGYIFNSFNLVESRDEETGTIAYTLSIKENPQAKVEKVIFKGNVKTKDYVMRRLMELKPGDVFSKAKLFESIKNFYNTQYFSSVLPEYDRGSQDLLVVLTITVEEQSTASIQTGASYTPGAVNNSFPLSAVLNWSDINFLGNGQTFAVKTNISLTSQDASISFGDDWLFGKRLSANIDFSFKHASMSAPQDSIGPIFQSTDPLRVPDPYETYEEYLAAGKIVPEAFKMKYQTWTFSIGYAGGYRIPTIAGTIGFGLGFIHEVEMKTYNSAIYRPFDPLISRNLNTWLFANTIFFRMYLNNLDLWYNPSNGYYASQKLGLTGWFNGEISHFIRSDTRIDGYVTLFDIPVVDSWSFKAVLAASSKFSILFKQPGRALKISDSSMLFVDGSFVGRGWSNLSSYLGTGLWENWLELRLPLLPNIFSFDSFFGATMIMGDQGILNIAAFSKGMIEYNKSLTGENFAFGFGFGIRFLIMQFPFRLYFAKQFVYEKDVGLRFTKTPWQFVFSMTTNLD